MAYGYNSLEMKADIETICGQCEHYKGAEYHEVKNPELDWMEGWRINCRVRVATGIMGHHFVVPGIPPKECPYRLEWLVIATASE